MRISESLRGAKGSSAEAARRGVFSEMADLVSISGAE